MADVDEILVRPSDGKCPLCRGQLRIVGADDATMEAECVDCGESMTVEPDAFNDGGIDYWPRAMVEFGMENESDFN